jgi:hypothetical protein
MAVNFAKPVLSSRDQGRASRRSPIANGATVSKPKPRSEPPKSSAPLSNLNCILELFLIAVVMTMTALYLVENPGSCATSSTASSVFFVPGRHRLDRGPNAMRLLRFGGPRFAASRILALRPNQVCARLSTPPQIPVGALFHPARLRICPLSVTNSM